VAVAPLACIAFYTLRLPRSIPDCLYRPADGFLAAQGLRLAGIRPALGLGRAGPGNVDLHKQQALFFLLPLFRPADYWLGKFFALKTYVINLLKGPGAGFWRDAIQSLVVLLADRWRGQDGCAGCNGNQRR